MDMDDHELCNAVFRFKHKAPNDRQEAEACQALVEMFAAFVASLKAVKVPGHKCGRLDPLADDRVVPASAFAVHEVEVLQLASQRLTDASKEHKRGDVWFDPWLPMYDCVIQRSKKTAMEVTLEVVFADGWERKLHFLPTGECVHSAVPSVRSVHASQCCVDLDVELEAKFSSAFDLKLREAQCSKGSERSAAAHTLGHQKTPQFIAAVVKSTVVSLMGESPHIGDVTMAPQGGTTDVGQHTGGRARDTCWAIVQEVVARNLCCERGLFKKTMVAIKLKLLCSEVQKFKSLLGSDTINLRDKCAQVDDMFYMLQVIIQDTVELLELKYEVSRLYVQCAALRVRLDAFANKLNLQTAARYVLPNDTTLEQLNTLKYDLEFGSPSRTRDQDSRETIEERHQRAWVNLEGFLCVNGASCTLEKLLQWIDSFSWSNACKSLLILRTVEKFMFEKALRLSDDLNIVDESLNFESVQTLLTNYQNVARQWCQLSRKASILNVEQRSREMLVAWIAFCLVHQKCVSEEPLFLEYKIALQWRNLKVAVVRERAAVVALQCVAKYIRSWNQKARGGSLFHLTKQEPTFEFGRKYGLNNSIMVSVYNRHLEDWNVYVRQKWNVVEQKKKEAAQLRDDIHQQKKKLSKKQQLLAQEEERLVQEYPVTRYKDNRFRHSELKSRLKKEIEQIDSALTQKQSSLDAAHAAPPYLTRPLPSAKADAIQIIFMLTMPRNIEILGSLCLSAQRALVSAEPTQEMKNLPDLSPTTWQHFYADHSPSQAVITTSNVFTANLAPFSSPRSWGPSSVDELHSLDQYISECVWNPHLVGTALTWTDSIGTKMDPFAASESSVISTFTEALPANSRQYQWMNAWPGDGDTRGNMVYANFDLQSEKFDKPAFVTLGSLRAFPNQQYRKLLWALLDDVLPWSNACVETIVRQSLYQVGLLTDEESPQLLWKTDMLSGDSGLSTFCTTLKFLAERLEQTPRDFKNLPLLSELAGFALQYSNSARHNVQLFSAMARRWAKNARLEYMNESSPRRIAEIRQKECILYGLALLAFMLGPWDNRANQEVCELIVLFRSSFLCASITISSSIEMFRTESKIIELMSSRIAELVAYVENNDMNTVLTGLVRLVSATSPEKLDWKLFSKISVDSEQFGSCFEAIDRSTDDHYSINLFNGVVLTNGYAPGGLPVSFREHDQFQVLFGPSNFEVFFINGLLRTEREYCGRLYDFFLEDDGEMFVQELKLNSSKKIACTLQLCSIKWIESMSCVLPARLQELYSHWYWVEQNCVLFRPKEAKCREVYFIATFGKGAHSRCYQVPFSDRKRSYEELLSLCDNYDHFTEKDATLLKVFDILTKFEIASFFHPLRSPKGVLKIELPRFKLSFFLSKSLKFESVEHKGYVLATTQQLDDFLPRFSRYLLLELQDKSDITRSELRILVPVGSVQESCDGTVDILLPSEADSRVETHCYDIHRRLKTFETETIGARLQLAAVCTRAGTSVPSKRLQMTGAEAALQMLRACRSCRPYSNVEKDTIVTIHKLSYREPAVKILAVSLLREADRLAFLFGQTRELSTSMASIDEKTEYADMCLQHVQRNPLRSQFWSKEEEFVLGHVQHVSVSLPGTEIVLLGPTPVAKNYVKSIESKLKRFICVDDCTSKKIPFLPLNMNTTNAMSKGMLDELRVSWKAHHSQVEQKLKETPNVLFGSFTKLLSDVSYQCNEMKNYLYNSYSKATNSERDQLLVLGNFLPQITVTDIVQCAFDEETLRKLAPKLSEKAQREFKKGVLRYMELCVLEDKLQRLVWKTKHSGELSDAQLVDELMNDRQWQSKKYPFWLAFEVEGRLQIRHEQYVIAQHLIDHSGSVCQLNMGRGKTRVILPMLFLYFTQSKCQKVVRAHFLSPLLSEARQYMHRYLSASSAQLSIFEQPFHRLIDLNARCLDILRDSLHEMKLKGGIQIVAPEHRMSLELKRVELQDEGSPTDTLDEILNNNQYVDVLDECDALLHHKYHLVYAVGIPAPLCNGMQRWEVAEALLRVVADQSREYRVAHKLRAPHVSCIAPDYSTRLGAYNGTRLNAVVRSTASLRGELKVALILDLIENAPFELMWLRTVGSMKARDLLVRGLTDSSVSLEEALGDHMSKLAPYSAQLLALRGLVAFGVLEHCLEKRYRVNFGLPHPGTRHKKIAIPYCAADVPSERSEYSHPDVCIVLTLLGYYHRGLEKKEVMSSFQMLTRLDISEQQWRYDQWFRSVESGLSDNDRKALCDVRHISLADLRQFETLYRTYRFCMEAINFYLNTCVFPNDTQQYPQRLSRTAWNVAANRDNIGFSGTNDNHRLLPFSVKQREPDEPSLLGTNGKMIDKIVQVTHCYDVTRPSSERNLIPWQCVLLFAMEKKTQALIDTGALLAGVANYDAAKFLLGQSEFAFAGVTYYDNREENNCWMIAEKARRIEVPLKKASMLEKETFVIFDEARSRGSDMKLLPDAVAVLTLGPKLTKDKLMQGAGRMRQLGCHQSLRIVSFDEVAQSILEISGRDEVSSISSVDVLNWVIDNTKAEAVRGLLEWGSNGLHFQNCRLNRDNELVDEKWDLETLYQEKIRVDSIARIIQSNAMFKFNDDLTDDVVAQICERGLLYGLDGEVCVTFHNDECERELQVDEEVQHVRELEIIECSPAEESQWMYSRILRAQSVGDLRGVVNVLDMAQIILQSITPKEMAALQWTKAQIFGTSNFFATVQTQHITRLNGFLRMIDVVLVFGNGDVLLVSECEADHILELLWSTRPSACNFHFVNLAFARKSLDQVGILASFQKTCLTLGSNLDRHLPLLSMIACQIFNGETMLTVEPTCRTFLSPMRQREATLSDFVKSRGNSHKWTRSFLHEQCCRLDLLDCEY